MSRATLKDIWKKHDFAQYALRLNLYNNSISNDIVCFVDIDSIDLLLPWLMLPPQAKAISNS